MAELVVGVRVDPAGLPPRSATSARPRVNTPAFAFADRSHYAVPVQQKSSSQKTRGACRYVCFLIGPSLVVRSGPSMLQNLQISSQRAPGMPARSTTPWPQDGIRSDRCRPATVEVTSDILGSKSKHPTKSHDWKPSGLDLVVKPAASADKPLANLIGRPQHKSIRVIRTKPAMPITRRNYLSGTKFQARPHRVLRVLRTAIHSIRLHKDPAQRPSGNGVFDEVASRWTKNGREAQFENIERSTHGL